MTCYKAVIDKTGTLLMGTSGDKEKIRQRVEACTSILSNESMSDMDESLLKRRIRRMSDGVAIIRVGGATEIEVKERRDRIDDALCASRAAKKGGIQPGGGTALVQAAKVAGKNKLKGRSESFQSGYDVLLKACHSPLRQIAINAGEVPEIVTRKITRSTQSIGWNALTGEYGNMFDMRIIDPHEVVVSSLTHATSVACNILSIGCALSLTDEEDNNLGLIEEL